MFDGDCRVLWMPQVPLRSIDASPPPVPKAHPYEWHKCKHRRGHKGRHVCRCRSWAKP